MVKDTFWYDGISAASMGITLRESLMVGGAIPRVERISVPGRNGDILYHDGSFENRPATASCFALRPRNVMQDVTRINNWLLSSYGYKELVIPEDRDHFFMAAVENGAEISTKLSMLAPFEINFTCQPERFLLSGKDAITIEGDEDYTVSNPTNFISHPLIHFYTDGKEVDVVIGGEFIESDNIGVSEFWFDAKTKNAYAPLLNLNNKIVASGEICLKPGANYISIFSSSTKIEIIPRWWEL